MESLTQILEEELENSFEVKDRKALHRSVILLVENLVGKERHQTEFHTLREDVGKAKDDLKSDMADLKSELRGEMVDLRTGLQGEMVDLKDEMKAEMSNLKNDMVEVKGEIKTIRETMQQGFTDIKHSQKQVISLMGIIFIVFGVLMSVYEFIR